MTHLIKAPPAVIWDWLTDNAKRKQWLLGSNFSLSIKPNGRTGPATRNHCVTSGYIEEILDWRPFQYYTAHLFKGRVKLMITSELEPTAEGIRLRWHLKWAGLFPRLIGGAMIRLMLRKRLRLTQNFKLLEQLIAQSAQKRDGPERQVKLASAQDQTNRQT